MTKIHNDSACFSGLSDDEIAVYRFIQAMSVEKKEALAMEFIQGMTDETKADFERQILGDSSEEKSSSSKNGIFCAASKLFSKGIVGLPKFPSSKTSKAA